jgi:hypothetical protein
MAGPVVLTISCPDLDIVIFTGPVWPLNGTEK